MPKIDPSKVRLFVLANIGKIRTIQDVADPFGVSADALRMQWKRAGERISMGQFIRRVRLQAALSQGQMDPKASCKEIAEAVGYSSLDVASRCFKRLSGQSMKNLDRSDIRLLES